MSRRLKVNDKVWVELTEKHEELLLDMDLIDSAGEILQGVRMYGTIRSVSHKNKIKIVHFNIYLPAVEEELQFSCTKTNKVVDETASVYFVVAPNNSGKNVIKKVADLVLSQTVSGYHLTMRDARQELRELEKPSTPSITTISPTNESISNVATATITTTAVTSSTTQEITAAPTSATSVVQEITVDADADAASACHPPPSATSADQEITAVADAASACHPPPPAVSACHPPPAVAPQSRHHRRRRRKQRQNAASAAATDDDSSSDSSSDDDGLDAIEEALGEVETDEEDRNDFMTDDEAETESDREETMLFWPQPKTWEKDKLDHPLLQECGEAQWQYRQTAPVVKRKIAPPPLKMASSGPESRTRSTCVSSWMHYQSYAFGREWWNDNGNSMVKIRYLLLLCYIL